MQSRFWSVVETLANTGSGFVISCMTNYYILPVFGCHVSHSQSIQITFIFTMISVLRSYLWRRFFNREKFNTKPIVDEAPNGHVSSCV